MHYFNFVNLHWKHSKNKADLNKLRVRVLVKSNNEFRRSTVNNETAVENDETAPTKNDKKLHHANLVVFKTQDTFKIM